MEILVWKAMKVGEKSPFTSFPATLIQNISHQNGLLDELSRIAIGIPYEVRKTSTSSAFPDYFVDRDRSIETRPLTTRYRHSVTFPALFGIIEVSSTRASHNLGILVLHITPLVAFFFKIAARKSTIQSIKHTQTNKTNPRIKKRGNPT